VRLTIRREKRGGYRGKEGERGRGRGGLKEKISPVESKISLGSAYCSKVDSGIDFYGFP
jgi:hypothetical protein